MKSNCLIWVLEQKWKYGGQIRWHKAKTWAGFHTTWVHPEGHSEWEFTLKKPVKGPWWYIPIWYEGVIKQVYRP